MSAELVMTVSPDWKELERVNSTAFEFLRKQHLTDECVNRFTMVICELVENGIKYGSRELNGATVQVQIRITENNFTVEVSNPFNASSLPFLHELDHTLQWVRGFQDPFEAYLARMKAISHEAPEANKSGLGIARIAYEGRASLDFFVNDNNTLNVSAVAIIE